MEQQGEKMTGLIDSTVRSGWVSQVVRGCEKGGQTSPITGDTIGNLLGSETLQGKWWLGSCIIDIM